MPSRCLIPSPDSARTPRRASASLSLPADYSCIDAPAFGGTIARARLRVRNEDFRVDEVLRFEPEGEGAHAWLRIEKSGKNTVDVARALARHAGVRVMDVGFAGQKDRHAVATQWFSVNLGKRAEPDWDAVATDGLKVLSTTRHGKKLRRGQLAGNRFCITLRNVRGDRTAMESRLEQIARCGVPNYFGAQRFGRNGENLRACASMFASGRRVGDRHRRGMFLSAARAWLFNRVLSRRVAEHTWNRALSGDILMFDDSRSRFAADAEGAREDPRLDRLELHPTGPLWGHGSPETASEVAILEHTVAREHALLSEGLIAAGLEADRRALRLSVKDLRYDFGGDDVLQIGFFLRAGAFATTVLGEIASTHDASPPGAGPDNAGVA